MTDQQRYSCQGCDRDDLTLTKNGRVRSHAPNGKRVGPDNPACPEGSNFPVQDTEFHQHRFQYGDDGHGHAGSVCVVDDCGMVEPEDESNADRQDEQPVPPNPFRAPLPGGVWDNLPNPDEPPTGKEVRMAMTALGAPDVPDNVAMAAEDIIDRATKRPAGPRSAMDFLDGEEDEDDYAEPAEDGGRSYWPARYDGSCSNCFAQFYEGDMIRRAEDGSGYEAQECCGSGVAAPPPERPRAVSRTLPVVRGRYKLPHPETGKPVSASRASKHAEGIADSYALDQWRHRMILVGVVKDPEILDKVHSGIRDFEDPLDAVKARREFLNEMAEKAMTAAGGSVRSTAGTTSHKYTEEVDAGTRELADVPTEFRRDATAYVHALESCGFRPVKGLIERSVYSDELKVSGTFDRVLLCTRTTDVLDLNGRKVTIHEGEYVIGDVKTGDNLEHPWLEILIQEAIYAHAVNENGVAVQDEPGGPFRWANLYEFGAKPVREDVGVVMHVPYGQGQAKFYATDLIIGWRGAKLCQANRDFWKIKLPKVPLASYTVAPDEVPEDGYEGPTAYAREGEPGFPEEPGETWSDPLTAAMMQAARDMGMLEADGSVVDYPPTPDPQEPEDERAAGSMDTWDGRTMADWTEAFKSVRTREGANGLWREAKDAGVPAETIKALVALVKLGDPKAQEPVSRPQTPPDDEPVAQTGGSRPPAAQRQDERPMAERAGSVTTKAEASAVWKEMNAKIAEMDDPEKIEKARAYRDKLAKIMKDRLAALPA